MVESIFILAESIADCEESVALVTELSVLTVVVSVVELEELDPQAIMMLTIMTVINFFIFDNLK